MATIKIRRFRTIVYAMCTLERVNFKVSTGIKIDDRYWENDQLSKKHPNYKSYKIIIDTTYQKMVDAYIKAKTSGYKLTIDLVRQEYYKDSPVKHVSNNFFKAMEDFINNKSATLSRSSINNYKKAMNILKLFEKKSGYRISADCFDSNFFNKFTYFLLVDHDLLNNTVHKHVKMIKAFLRFQYPKLDVSFMKFKEYTPEIIALTERELSIVKEASLSGFLLKTRDLFLFLCYTGMRYSDSQELTFDWEKDGVLDFQMRKTKGRAITPLTVKSKEILIKYNGTPKISNQKFNVYLKTLFKKLELNRTVVTIDRQGSNLIKKAQPLYEVVTSHIGRKTFITTLLRRGVSIQDVMIMSGHADYGEVRKYYEISADHIRKNFSNLEF